MVVMHTPVKCGRRYQYYKTMKNIIFIIFHENSLSNFEFSWHVANEILRLDKLYLIFPGQEEFPLSENAKAVGLERFLRNHFS
jgi:hypothetical protein